MTTRTADGASGSSPRRAHAEQYAGWFAVLADPTRVRLLHEVSTSPTGVMDLADLAVTLGVGRPTCEHHVEVLRAAGFVVVEEVGTARVVSTDPAAARRVPHAVDALLGLLAPSGRPSGPPGDVTVRPVEDRDLARVLEIYAEGIATGNATFETRVPGAEELRARWLPDLAWVAEIGQEVVGWTAVVPTSARECYAGVGESSVYVSASARGRGVGRSLLHAQVTGADAAGLWTLQTSIFPENRASLALHRSAGYRTLAVRDRIAQLDGVWRDTVLLERRRED